MKAIEGHGRRVSKAAHDGKYEMIPDTLKVVQEAGLYDHILIYGRLSPEDSKTKSGIRLIESNPDDPLLCYLNERDRAWSQSTIRYYNDCCDSVVHMMENRRAYNQIDVFKKNVGIS